jgi:hypothetical protein
MADVIQIEAGHAPWRPAEDAELVKQYRYYEIPTAGVIQQHRTRYLFCCIAGQEERISFWLYTRLSSEDETALDEAPLEEFNHAIGLPGPAVIALVLEGPGVVSHRVIDELTEGSIAPTVQSLIEELEQYVLSGRDLEEALVH